MKNIAKQIIALSSSLILIIVGFILQKVLLESSTNSLIIMIVFGAPVFCEYTRNLFDLI